MRFIPEAEAEALRTHFENRLEGPVTLDLFIEPKFFHCRAWPSRV